MSTPEEEPRPEPETGPRTGSYGEIAPGVPRFGQYAPEGYQPPAQSQAPAGRPPQGTPHGTSPGTPGGVFPGEGSRVAPPRQVEISFRLILLAGLIEAVVVVLGVVALMTPAGQSTARQVLQDMGLEDQSLLQPLLIASLAISIVAVGLYALIAFQVRKGRNWARITGAVFAALSLFSLLQPNVITIVQVALGVIAEIILFRAPAKDYFKPRSFRR